MKKDIDDWMTENDIQDFPCARCDNCGLYLDAGITCHAEDGCGLDVTVITEEDIEAELAQAEYQANEAARDRAIDLKIDERRGK